MLILTVIHQTYTVLFESVRLDRRIYPDLFRALMASIEDTEPPRVPEFGEVLGTAELNDALYDLDEAETKFIIEQTGLKGPGEVKEHLLRIQHEVYSVSESHRTNETQSILRDNCSGLPLPMC